jgi:mannosyltransferase
MSEFASGVSITAEKSVARRQASWAAQALGQLARDQLVLLSAVCVLGLGLRLWDIGRRSFWLDELSAVGTSALSFQDLLQALTVEANMTLYYWALFVWLRIVGFGADEGAIRLLSAVIGAVAVPLTYLLGRRLHSSAAGLAAAALLAVNGYHVLMSQEARAYALLSTLTVLSYILLDRALQSGRRRDWALHGLVTVLAFYCHFYTALTVVAQGVFVLSRRSRAAPIGMGISGLVMGLLLAQLVPFFLRQSHGAKLSHVMPPDFGDVTSLLVGFSGGSLATLTLYGLLAIVGVLLGGRFARPPGYRNWLLLAWFFVPVGLALAVSLARPIFEDRYLFATLPALPLLAGIGIARLPRLAGVAVVGVIAGLSLWALQGDLEVRRNEQWREAAAYATNNAQTGDGWIFISKWGQNGFEYYAGWRWGTNPSAPYADVLETFDWRAAFNVPKYRGLISMAELERFAASHPRIWLVLSHEFEPAEGIDTAAPVRDWLSRHGYAASQRQFRYVRVLLYQRRGPA